MFYSLYQAQSDLLAPWRQLARGASTALSPWAAIASGTGMDALAQPLRYASAACELFAHTTTTHKRPDYGITEVQSGNVIVPVTEEVALATPFGSLLHFRKDGANHGPPVLIVAPMSGHFATLLRATVRTMLRDHDVYITDWVNARDVPLSAGKFDLDDFTGTIISFLRHLGKGSHVVAVCQPTPSVMAAVSVMAEAGDKAVPNSMTLMAGPIDTRINPTKVNDLAKAHDMAWFENNLIDTVPWRFAGAGRRVYPGVTQLTAFMSMNIERHLQAHIRQFRNLVSADVVASDAHRRFYDEYLAVMDLPAEFYLQTIQTIFQDHALPLGKLTYQGRKVNPSAIRRTALLTVEGEKDDICAIGQTMAALDICDRVPLTMKNHHLQTGVGHYGVFSGRRWDNEVYPRVREVIQTNAL
ncbi:polyhydroxyalkanoate depolymerase [Acetobacteraceae bacterium H6797]|nr:polyhydroxyalkanoate depolymerase [Acetobacteraceae bacterium H6797]